MSAENGRDERASGNTWSSMSGSAENVVQARDIGSVHFHAADSRWTAIAFWSRSARAAGLYVEAVKQLGDASAPIRIGGLHALARLAQSHPRYRQDVVDKICAYLRMTNPHDDRAIGYTDAEFVSCPEFEVRRTAQGILTSHLRRPAVGRTPKSFWPNIDIGLERARLFNLDLSGCHIRTANFVGAWITGAAGFSETTFSGDADFYGVHFDGAASFARVAFHGRAQFGLATFCTHPWFANATFHGVATFDDTDFQDDAVFVEATFLGPVAMDKASFRKQVVLDLVWASPNVPHRWPRGWHLESNPAAAGLSRLIYDGPPRSVVRYAG